jgi:carbon storage regulator CsrA
VLVLSRRLNEQIVLPELNITIQIVAIKPGVVRIGIEAPPDVPVLREELLEKEQALTSHCANRATPQLCSR